MFDSTNHETMRLVLNAFSKAAHENYGSHAFSSGYLQSTVLNMFNMLPKRVQRSYIDGFVRECQKQESEAIRKMHEKKVVDTETV